MSATQVATARSEQLVVKWSISMKLEGTCALFSGN